MRCLTERLNLAKTVLKELSREPLCRTELEQRTIGNGAHATFEGIFHYLIQSGYVQKSAQTHRANYVITDKGTKFLEAIA